MGGSAVNGTSLAPSRRVGHFPTPLSHMPLLPLSASFDDIRFLLHCISSVSTHCHEKLVIQRSAEISAVKALFEHCFKFKV